MRAISIDIDTASGAIRLKPGYAEGSPEFASETSLFAEYEPAIVEILVKEVPSDDPAYKAFLEAANEDRDARHELLARVRTSVVVASDRSEEHTSELQSLMRISYAGFCLKKKKSSL